MAKREAAASVRSPLFTKWALVGAGVLAAVYVAVVALYAADLRGSSLSIVDIGDDSGVSLEIRPHAIDPVRHEFAYQLLLTHDADATEVPASVHVEISDAATGAPIQTLDLEVGAVASPEIITSLVIERRIEAWPFDAYLAGVGLAVTSVSADGRSTPIAPTVFLDGGVPAWNISPGNIGDDGATHGELDLFFDVHRSFSTFAFALVLVASMVLMAVIAVSVSVSVNRGWRATQVSFLSWIAGMLFAVPALRGFLPGSPPFGSWVDFLIVLWVIVALVISLALLVHSWFRDSRRSGHGH